MSNMPPSQSSEQCICHTQDRGRTILVRSYFCPIHGKEADPEGYNKGALRAFVRDIADADGYPGYR